MTDAERLQTGSVGESTILEAKEHRNHCALPRTGPSGFPHFSYESNDGSEFDWIAIQGLNNLTVAVEGPTSEVNHEKKNATEHR